MCKCSIASNCIYITIIALIYYFSNAFSTRHATVLFLHTFLLLLHDLHVAGVVMAAWGLKAVGTSGTRLSQLVQSVRPQSDAADRRGKRVENEEEEEEEELFEDEDDDEL